MNDKPTLALQARAAQQSDSRLLFDWRNDEETRAASRSISPVSWDEHAQWFAAVIADPLRHLYIVETSEEPAPVSIGMCRFDGKDGAPTEISINLDPAFRGRGLSAQVLRLAIDTFRAGGGGALKATIRPGNVASVRAFEHVGFRLSGSTPEFDTYLG